MIVKPNLPVELVRLTIKIPSPLNQTLNQYTELVSSKSGQKITTDEVVSQLLDFAIQKDSEFKKHIKKANRKAGQPSEAAPSSSAMAATF